MAMRGNFLFLRLAITVSCWLISAAVRESQNQNVIKMNFIQDLKKCSDGFQERGGKCYMIVDEILSREKALFRCDASSSHLVSIHDVEENDFIINLLLKHRTTGGDIPLNELYWTSGRSTGADWHWEPSQDTISFFPNVDSSLSLTTQGESNQEDESDPQGERCILIESDPTKTSDYIWTGASCSETKAKFICEQSEDEVVSQYISKVKKIACDTDNAGDQSENKTRNGAGLYFPMDELNSNGNLMGSIVGTFPARNPTVPGLVGNALSLDGISRTNYVDFGRHSDTCFGKLSECTNGFTILFWIKFGEKHENRCPECYIFTNGGHTMYSQGYSLYWKRNSIHVWIRKAGERRNLMKIQPGPLVVGEWMHVAVTWDGQDGADFYVNGLPQVVNVSHVTYRYGPPGNVVIGAPHNSLVNPNYKGQFLMDDLYFMNRVLTRHEIDGILIKGLPQI